MAKISELTTLTAPVTSSDLAMMIRPNALGGYSSYKTPLDNFGRIRVTGSIGVTGSMVITGSGDSLIISGSGLFGSGNSVGFYGANKMAAMAHGSNGYARTELATGFTLHYKGGLHVWSSGSESPWSSGSNYMWYNIAQSKVPFGGLQQYGYIVRSQYAGTTQGSASYLTFTPTASQALWVLRPSFNDQTDAYASSQFGDAFDLSNPPGDVHALTFKVVTGSGVAQFSVLTAGPENSEYSTGSFAAVGSSGRYGGFRMPYGTIFAPRAYGVQLGNLGIASYTTAVKMGFENGGGIGHIVLCSGSNMPGVYSSYSASLGLIVTDGDLLLYTGAFNEGGVRIIGSTRTTGSITVGGYLNLQDGAVAGLGASDVRSGSMTYVSSSGELLVFTGDGATTHRGATGWKVATLT